MKSAVDCRLRFNSFTIVWCHVFNASGGVNATSLRPFVSPTDEQIFHDSFLRRDALKRYHAPGFQIFLQLDATDASAIISGRAHVQVAEYFGDTVCVTYRLLVGNVPNFCKSSRALTSDELILLAGIPASVERWSARQRAGAELTSLDAPIYRCEISDLAIAESGSYTHVLQSLHGSNEVLRLVLQRYQRAFTDRSAATNDQAAYDLTHVLIDVWEDVAHDNGDDFATQPAEAVVTHIEGVHRSELMGILTLYPYEWPFRDARYFGRVCGDNIAIDSDDLVLVGDNASIVIGTYGRRGDDAPTNWKAVLTDRPRDHVSWPEFLAILEVGLAKLQKISDASLRLQSADVADHLNGGNDKQLRRNAVLTLQVTRMMVDLNSVVWSRYQSHKLMSELTEERLNVPAEVSNLLIAAQQVDSAMRKLDDLSDARRSRLLNTLVAFITLASAFQVIFMHVRVPIIDRYLSGRAADQTGVVIILTVAAVLAGAIILGIASFLTRARRGLAGWTRRGRVLLSTVSTTLSAARSSTPRPSRRSPR